MATILPAENSGIVYGGVRVFRYLCSLHDKTDFIFLLTIRIIRYTFLMISLSKNEN